MYKFPVCRRLRALVENRQRHADIRDHQLRNDAVVHVHMILIIPRSPLIVFHKDIFNADLLQAFVPCLCFAEQLFPLFAAHLRGLCAVVLHNATVPSPAQLIGNHRIQEITGNGKNQQNNQNACSQFLHSIASVSVPAMVVCIPVRLPKH